MKYYDLALQTDPSNIYAAMGASIALASGEAHKNDVKDMLAEVKEMSSTAVTREALFNASMNLAHVYIILSQTSNAIFQVSVLFV